MLCSIFAPGQRVRFKFDQILKLRYPYNLLAWYSVLSFQQPACSRRSRTYPSAGIHTEFLTWPRPGSGAFIIFSFIVVKIDCSVVYIMKLSNMASLLLVLSSVLLPPASAGVFYSVSERAIHPLVVQHVLLLVFLQHAVYGLLLHLLLQHTQGQPTKLRRSL